MKRLMWFAENAGVGGCGRFLIVLLLVCYLGLAQFQTGDWVITFPAAFAVVGVLYASRNFMIAHYEVFQIAMNVVAVIGIAGTFFVPNGAVIPGWVTHALFVAIVAYLAAYFLMMSSERRVFIARRR